VTKHLLLLVAGSLAIWAVAALPARWLGGEQAIAYSATALVICLVPTSLTLVWAERMSQPSPQRELLLVVVGTGLRMTFALGAGLVLYFSVPYFQQTSLWAWILIYYLVTLGLETVMLSRTRAVPPGQA
jgi:hypothetical protein